MNPTASLCNTLQLTATHCNSLQLTHELPPINRSNDSHIFLVMVGFVGGVPSCAWVVSHTWISHVTHVNESCHTREWVMSRIHMSHSTDMGWLRLVGSFKLQFSFAKEPYKRDYLLQKRPIILRSLLIVATSHVFVVVSFVGKSLRTHASVENALVCVLQCVVMCSIDIRWNISAGLWVMSH